MADERAPAGEEWHEFTEAGRELAQHLFKTNPWGPAAVAAVEKQAAARALAPSASPAPDEERLTAIAAATPDLVAIEPLERTASPAPLREALEACAALPCIRQFWGARRPCPEYDDGRELCATCKARAALAEPES